MPAKDIAAFLGQRPMFTALPAREIDTRAAVAVEEVHRPRTSCSGAWP